MTEVIFKEEPKKTKAIPKSRKAMAINQPQSKQAPQQYFEPERSQDNYVFDGIVPTELKGGLKNIAITGLSYPAGSNKTKLALNLFQSTYTNSYLDKYMCIDMIKCLDDHSKFALVYLFNFLDAYISPNIQPTMPQTKPTKENMNDIQNLN